MDVERLLISRILVEAELLPLTQGRVTPEWFEDSDSKRGYEWIIEYWQQYSDLPTAAAFKREFPTYKLVKSDDALEYLVEELRRRRRFGLLQDGLFEAVEKIRDRETDAAMQAVQQAITQLSIETAGDVEVNLVDTWADRMEGYRELRDLPNGMRGVPTGFPSIDRALSGLQDKQLITFIGLPKSGKSTMLLKMAMAIHAYGKTPLFIGFEMSNAEQEARHDAMLARISHQRLLNGRLSDKELDQLEEELRKRKNMHPFYLSSDITSTQTVSGVQGKIEQLQPDVVFIDGTYMMLDEVTGEHNTPQALTNITRSLKRLAQNHTLPIVATTQALNWKVSKRQGLTSNAIGYSSSFLQDSDVVLGVESVEDADDLKKVSVLDARSAPRMAVMIRWDWDTGDFSEEGEADFGDDESKDEKLAERMGYDD